MGNLLKVVLSFSKIGFVALGGGHSMLKLIEYEAVISRHWLIKEEFVTMVGSTFLFPGLTAVKLSALIGYKAAGIGGLILAVICLNLPGLLLAFLGYRLLVNNDSLLAKKLVVAVQYGALALLASASFSIAKSVVGTYFSPWLFLLAMLFFIALALFDLSPFWGLLLFIAAAYTLIQI